MEGQGRDSATADRVPRIDVATIADAAVRRGARRAIERAMKSIEGSFYVNGQYFANEFDADRARTAAANRVISTIERRPELFRNAFDDTSWAADDFAREMQARIQAGRDVRELTHTVLCSWCVCEGHDGIMHQGNPALPPSHGICLTHATSLLEHAGICADDLA